MQEPFNLDSYVMHHVLNSQEWHLPFLPTIHIPEPLSLHGLMVLLCASFLIVIFGFVYNKQARVPTGMTNALESVVLFIRNDISINFLGEKDGKKMAPLFCTFFFFVLTLNLIGLIPNFASATGNINVTGALALITLSFMIFGTIYKNGIGGFFKAIIPPGIPILILPLIVLIEFCGIFIKAMALMIRLYANMLSGHIVIICLVGLVVLFGVMALPSVLLAVMIYLLEVLVVFLQAYIFTLLSALFIGQMYHPHH